MIPTYNNVPPAKELPIVGGVPEGVVNAPVEFQTITTLSLFEFGVNDNSISVALTPVTENESTSSGIYILHWNGGSKKILITN